MRNGLPAVLTREDGVDSEGLVQGDGHAHCLHIVLLVEVVGKFLLPTIAWGEHTVGL